MYNLTQVDPLGFPVPDNVLPQGFSQNYRAPRVNINIMLKFKCFCLLILWALLATALQDFSRLALILCLFHSQSDSWFKSSNVHWETNCDDVITQVSDRELLESSRLRRQKPTGFGTSTETEKQ
ncbi:hypothetical protein KEM48_004422 [Puccinia striiformis f. sp. tritici PST-130]|nr:hypothetical protein KEM48_004422 [Puccinia striiformis f. sp. tritici PST-130]